MRFHHQQYLWKEVFEERMVFLVVGSLGEFVERMEEMMVEELFGYLKGT